MLRITGIIGTALGLILAIFGVYLWFISNPVHHKLGPGMLVVGVVLLAVGAFAYTRSAKPKGAM